MSESSKIENKIGIPRAISYYCNYPFYYGFFKALGIEIILSDKTTAKIINDGCKYLVSDTCLPIKVFTGHVINLLEKGCDKIFVPSIQSTAFKINNCSKIRGLPEIIRNVINKPFKMIEPTLDKTENINLNDFCSYIANEYEITDAKIIKSAIQSGWQIYNNFIEMGKSGIPYFEALKNAQEDKFIKKSINIVRPISVAVMAHGYNLFDEHISMNLIRKLEKMGVTVYTSLNVSHEESISAIESIGEFQYWANELELTGVAAHYLLNHKADGIIALSAFGCGPDSLMFEEISHHAAERNMPIIHLTIDEHTGEAGFITRIEAFIDMLIRRKRANIIKMPDERLKVSHKEALHNFSEMKHSERKHSSRKQQNFNV